MTDPRDEYGDKIQWRDVESVPAEKHDPDTCSETCWICDLRARLVREFGGQG